MKDITGALLIEAGNKIEELAKIIGTIRGHGDYESVALLSYQLGQLSLKAMEGIQLMYAKELDLKDIIKQ